MNDITVYIGQSEIPSRVTVSKFLMIESHQVEDRRLQVMHMDAVFDRGKSEFIGSAVNVTSANTTPCHPHAEAIVVVVATVHFALVGARNGEFYNRCPSKFATPNH